MKLRSILLVLAIVAVATVCVRLGLWQVSRLHERRALNEMLDTALAAPPLSIESMPRVLGAARWRRVEARGRYDETRQVLLSNRSNDGSPGVDVVTPLLLPGDSVAVLVNRGWLYAPDGMTARPDRYAEPGERLVIGVADSLRRGAGGPPVRRLPPDSTEHWSARWLDSDSLASRFPYALAPWVIHQLPGPGIPDAPARRSPRRFVEMTHISYAVQWFLFAAILVGGSAAVAWRRRRGGERTIPRSS